MRRTPLLTTLLLVVISCMQVATESNVLIGRDSVQYGFFDIQDCDERRQEAVRKTIEEMFVLARSAADKWTTIPAWTAFFGSNANLYNKETDDYVRGYFDTLARFNEGRFTRVSIFCPKVTRDFLEACRGAGSGSQAASTKRYSRKIYLCDTFWSGWFPEGTDPLKTPSLSKEIPPMSDRFPSKTVRMDPYRTAGSILLHEMTHAVFGTEDYSIKSVEKSTEPAYGQENTLLLAQTDPWLARNNADSFAMFSLAAFWPRACFSLDPSRLEKDCAARDELRL